MRVLEEGKALQISRGNNGGGLTCRKGIFPVLGPLEGTSSGGPEPLVHLIVTWFIFPV
jgi:hypothetical protein